MSDKGQATVTDESARRRPWFRFHLSTAIFAIIVASLLMFLNFYPSLSGYVNVHRPNSNPPDLSIDWWYFGSEGGWPVKGLYVVGKRKTGSNFTTLPSESWHWDANLAMLQDWILPNLLSALAILLATAILCEWWIRRRERRRQGIPK